VESNLLKRNANIIVVACGEQWADATEHENKLRPGIEDYLGAGLILSKLAGSKSPEAEACIGAYDYSKHKIQELVWESASGRELRERGFGQDVTYCSQIDQFDVVPTLKKLFTSHRIFDNICATFKCDEETSR
jgi:2-phosphosulfolactate phosphatase